MYNTLAEGIMSLCCMFGCGFYFGMLYADTHPLKRKRKQK